jgi:hypothetical protein
VPDAAPPSTEVIHRPAPGVARGLWEAPPYAFYVALAAVIFFAVPYAAYRLGLLKRRAPARKP